MQNLEHDTETFTENCFVVYNGVSLDTKKFFFHLHCFFSIDLEELADVCNAHDERCAGMHSMVHIVWMIC